MRRLLWFTLWLVLLFCDMASAEVLVFNRLGTFVTKTTLATAATSADCAGKTIVVTSAQSLAGNMTWPSDRSLRIESGGSIYRGSYSLTVNGPFSAVPHPCLSGTGTLGIPVLDVEDFTNLNDAITQVGSSATTLRLSSTVAVTSNLTIPANVKLQVNPGGVISHGTYTVAVTGPLTAGDYNILTGTGAVTFNMGSVRRVPVIWFSEDTVGLQAAIDSARAAAIPVIPTTGQTYTITSTINLGVNGVAPNLIGDNVTFNYSALVSVPCLDVAGPVGGGNGALSKLVIKGITFNGSSTSRGIDVRGVNFVAIQHCEFNTNATGIRLHNDVVNSWTEYVVADDCYFQYGCALSMEYKRTSGNESFHGSGLKNCTINSTIGNYSVYIGPGCFVYNAPMSFNIWTFTNSQSVIRNDGYNYSYVHGDITIECMSTGVSVVSTAGNPLVIAGTVEGIGKFTLGNLVLASAVNKMGTPDGNIFAVDTKPQTTVLTLSSGYNSGPIVANGSLSLAFVNVTGTNYEDRVLLALNNQGYGGMGTATILMQAYQTNVAGLASYPTYVVDTTGHLGITMPTLAGGTYKAQIVMMNSLPLSQ